MTDAKPINYALVSPLLDATAYSADGALISACTGSIQVTSQFTRARGDLFLFDKTRLDVPIAKLRTHGREFEVDIMDQVGRWASFYCVLDEKTRDAIAAPVLADMAAQGMFDYE